MRVAVIHVVLLVSVSLAAAQEPAATQPAAPTSYPGWVTPKKHEKLAPHPRLFVSQSQIERTVKGRSPEYAAEYEAVAATAERALTDVDQPFAGASPLDRSFWMLGRLLSLSVEWHRTRDRRYLDAAISQIRAMRSWLPPDGDIILWEGQHIAAIAMTYDLLHNDLTPEQRAELVSLARRHCIEPFLRVTGNAKSPMVAGERGSWWQNIISNWNPVCVAGAGMLALTMYEDVPEAQTVIDRVESSLAPVMDYLQTTQGGWVEGLGYWNWTIHYMSLFMISYERSTGKAYPGFSSDGFRETLLFGLHFVPYAQACGFGDNQHGNISPSLLLAAEHLGQAEVLRQLQEYQARHARHRVAPAKPATQPASTAPTKRPHINYDTPLRLLINPDPVNVPAPPARKHYLKMYPEQGWGMLADRWPEPNVYASFRGGIAGGAHTHADLLSWNGVVGAERMILDYNHAGYYSPAFYARAREIPERSPVLKNTLFIAGISAYINESARRPGPARSKDSHFMLPTGPVARLDATRAFFLGSGNPRLVCRAFVLLDDKGVLVLDRVEQPAGNPVEVRTHTDRHAEFGTTDVLLRGDVETARLTFASDQPAVLRRAEAMLTDARAKPPVVMRWQSLNNVRNFTSASLLSRGPDPVTLTVTSDDAFVTVNAEGKGWKHQVRLTRRLEPVDSAKEPTSKPAN